jgi:hypothetical protein
MLNYSHAGERMTGIMHSQRNGILVSQFKHKESTLGLLLNHLSNAYTENGKLASIWLLSGTCRPPWSDL